MDLPTLANKIETFAQLRNQRTGWTNDPQWINHDDIEWFRQSAQDFAAQLRSIGDVPNGTPVAERIAILCAVKYPGMSSDLTFHEDVLLSASAHRAAVMTSSVRPFTSFSAPAQAKHREAVLDGSIESAIDDLAEAGSIPLPWTWNPNGTERGLTRNSATTAVTEYLKPLRARAERIKREDPALLEEVLRTDLAQVKEWMDQIQSSRNAAVHSADAARRASGNTAENRLAVNFSTDATSDGWKAFALSSGAIASIGGSAGIAGWALHDAASSTSPSWQELVARLALAIPVLAVSGYLGRLSAHYRSAARWAKTAAVQLKSIDAYTEGFKGDTDADELRAALGRRVFGETHENDSPRSADIDDLRGLLEAIAKATRRE